MKRGTNNPMTLQRKKVTQKGGQNDESIRRPPAVVTKRVYHLFPRKHLHGVTMEFPTTHWFRSDWTELPKFTRFNSASIDAYGHTRHDTAGASFVAFLSYFVFLILSYLRSVSLLSFSVSCACIRFVLQSLLVFVLKLVVKHFVPYI